MDETANPAWPVLKTYDAKHVRRIAMPLGGIGTGTVALGGRGNLRDWEIANRPAKGFQPAWTFFALRAQAEGAPAVTRVLEGPLDDECFDGASGATAPNHGLPRFRQVEFRAAYPFAQVLLADPDVPLSVRLEAFNPLVPGDADASGLPVAVLRYVLTNPGRVPVEAAVAGNLENIVGVDGSGSRPCRNVNVLRQSGGVHGLYMSSEGVAPAAEAWGTLALTTLATAGVSARPRWWALSWNRDILDVWEDFAADGVFDDRPVPVTNPAEEKPRDEAGIRGSLAVRLTVPPGGEAAVTFLLTWHFPNRRTWTPQAKEASPAACAGGACCDPDRIGNYYTTRFADAWAVAESVAADLPGLEARSLAFVRAFCAADLPAVVQEAALFNLSSLRSQTCFRTEDGRLYGWEGCHDRAGCCHGSCTHVWNYEQATAFLFGDLAWSMREVEFLHATGEDGHMNFRVSLPLPRARTRGLAAADGQMGCLMKLYRDWQLSGDDERLRHLWPAARRALAFCWVPGGWDGDADGVMEGCQHNTMDVEYYGPNPQMQIWYLGALRAAQEMAEYLNDAEFAARCRDLFRRGRAWTDQHLFNGEYYEHEIRPVADPSRIAPGLRSGMGADDPAHPIFQLGSGCLVDQLVGQFLAHVCGLGHLTRPAHVRKTLRSIMKHNFRKSFWGHVNNMRSYALNDESALLMASYPRGRRPTFPFPYFGEVMTGFEYTAAIGMLYEGQTAAGLRCIQAIRRRYDGRRRNPFDEAECGHHYARAMAAWAAVLALSGFQYSGVTCTITFAGRPGTHFWSNGWAWGTCRVSGAEGGPAEVELAVLHGRLALRRLVLSGRGEKGLGGERVLAAGAVLALSV